MDEKKKNKLKKKKKKRKDKANFLLSIDTDLNDAVICAIIYHDALQKILITIRTVLNGRSNKSVRLNISDTIQISTTLMILE